MKKTMGFVMGLAFAASVAACGGSQQPAETTPPPVETTPTETMDADAGMGDEMTPAPTGATEGNPCGAVAGSGEAAGNPCGK